VASTVDDLLEHGGRVFEAGVTATTVLFVPASRSRHDECKAKAASGMAITVYPAAQARFWIIVRYDAREGRSTAPRRSTANEA
jgi:hypothetical protein